MFTSTRSRARFWRNVSAMNGIEFDGDGDGDGPGEPPEPGPGRPGGPGGPSESDKFTCFICNSILLMPVDLPCTHRICLDCFENSMTIWSSMACPFCRRRLSNWWRSAKNTGTVVDQVLWDRIQKSEFYTDIDPERLSLLQAKYPVIPVTPAAGIMPTTTTSSSTSSSSSVHHKNQEKYKNENETEAQDLNTFLMSLNVSEMIDDILKSNSPPPPSSTSKKEPYKKSKLLCHASPSLSSTATSTSADSGQASIEMVDVDLCSSGSVGGDVEVDTVDDQMMDEDSMSSFVTEGIQSSALNQPNLGQPSTSSSKKPKSNVKANMKNSFVTSNNSFHNIIDVIDLKKKINFLPTSGVKPPEISLNNQYLNAIPCSSEIFRCTLTMIPYTPALHYQSKINLGILLHPFKEVNSIVQSPNVIRCIPCGAFINPFINYLDKRRRTWNCNFCGQDNYIPSIINKTFKYSSKSPELSSSTIEYSVLEGYSIRPPQNPIYLFLFDVSCQAVDSDYLKTACDSIIENLIDGQSNESTQIGFITYDDKVHFYNLIDDPCQAKQMIVNELDDMFFPCPQNRLIVNLSQNRRLIRQFLTTLPDRFLDSSCTVSALGSAIQIGHKLLSDGGRITIFQCILPTIGLGPLVPRDQDEIHINEDLRKNLNPLTYFYKNLALESLIVCIDLFILNQNYIDIASLADLALYSGGEVLHFPKYHSVENPGQCLLFEQGLGRYLSKNIGFEALLKVRCSRGLRIVKHHGNHHFRDNGLLVLPNCSSELALGFEVEIEKPLVFSKNVCFQSSLLYTSNKGERKLRVHTLCLPVSDNLNDIISSVDQQCLIGILAKKATDVVLSSNLFVARQILMNTIADILSLFNSVVANGILDSDVSLNTPSDLQILPLYIFSLLKSTGFHDDFKMDLDERSHFLHSMKTLPLYRLIQTIYPDLYIIHDVARVKLKLNIEERVPDFPRFHLRSDLLKETGVYLMDTPYLILIVVCPSVRYKFCADVLGIDDYFDAKLTDMKEIPQLDTSRSVLIRNFIEYLQKLKPYFVPIKITRNVSLNSFTNFLLEDKSTDSSSYFEFLDQLQDLVEIKKRK